MRSFSLGLLLLVVAFECYHAYKLADASDFMMSNRLSMFAKKNAAALDAILYPANVQDDSLLSEELEDRYRQIIEGQRQKYNLLDSSDDSAAATDENELYVSENDDENTARNFFGRDDIELKADPRDEETESHSSLVAGHQYVSGGAGEGKQHLQPDGAMPNKEEVKSDEDLPAYCDPPNPCPVGYSGEDCDPRPYSEYTAEYSKAYQEQQNCMCDDDHNECSRTVRSKITGGVSDFIQSIQKSQNDLSPAVAKKSPRVRRDLSSRSRSDLKMNKYLRGPALRHVAKKSTNV